uniref:Ring canal kelch protein n=1 Tax=Daphnia magna TaxID=35525 RepID=A0A0P6H9G6_9CRUS
MTFSKSLADSSQSAMNQVAKKTSSSEPVKPLKSQNWCSTEYEIDKVDFEWNVRVACFESLNEFFGSPSTSFFPSKRNPCMKWTLTFCEDSPGFRILLESYTPHSDLAVLDEPVRVKVSLLNIKREMLLPKVTVLPKDSKVYHEVLHLDKKTLNECLQKDGSFSIYCEIEMWMSKETGSGVFSCPGTSRDVETVVPQLDLQVPPKKKRIRRRKKKNSIEELFKKMNLSDVTLVVGGREFHVNKTVIASRSPVLAALFKTAGESSTRVEVKDVDPDVFQEVLRFIYTGKVPLDKMAKMEPEIYVAAHKFQLDALKYECVNYKVK